MSMNPFIADPRRRERYAALASRLGAAVGDEIARRARVDAVLPAADIGELVAQFELEGVRDLMVLGLGAAQRLAQPPISGFYVGAIGLERETGNLLLGGNVEFPGTTLGHTIHGEGFVLTRAFNRGTTVVALAIGEAHPCAHCRQFLSEFASSGELRLIDPLGHDLGMADLYPWPFDPMYLGEVGIVPGALPFPNLAFDGVPPPAAIAEALLAAGRRAHAPYGKCPAAVVLQLVDGRRFAGATIESVAFNPSLGPLPAAIVEVLAHGGRFADISACWVASVTDGAVRHARSVAELLAAVAPGAELFTHGWRT